MKHINKEHITRNTKYVNCLNFSYRRSKNVRRKNRFSRYFRYFCTTYGEQMNEDFLSEWLVMKENEQSTSCKDQ